MDQFEIKLDGLTVKQKVLADILWKIEEWNDVERFIEALPPAERQQCESIIEMMRLELVDTYRRGIGIDNTPEADRVIQQFRLTR